jgi:hypothetical protein
MDHLERHLEPGVYERVLEAATIGAEEELA